MFVTQFHVSPTQRCSTRARGSAEKSVRPHARHTSVDDAARSSEMVIQMIGNAKPGGVHDGRFTSARTGARRFPGSFS